jgi:hypothetical protein
MDLETVPDEDRMHLFGLPPLPDVPPETTSANCPTPATMLEVPLERLERDLLELNPDDAYLELLVIEERKKAKPRAGVEGACKKVRGRKYDVAGAAESQRKMLSVTPEYCRIAAVGWAIGDGKAHSSVIASNGVTEQELLWLIWDQFRQHSPIVGYNFLGFDLQVIRARSIILGVEPTKIINDSPWNNRDIEDLMNVRFGRSGKAMKLKDLARLYGVPVPAGGVDGSDVGRLLAEDPAKVGEYVRSDVEVIRGLHRKFQGYYCV